MARSSGSGSSSNSDSTSHSNPDSNSGSGVEVSFEVDLAAPAIVFAVFYTIMLLYSLGRVLKNSTTRVFVFLTLFCASELADATIPSESTGKLTVRLVSSPSDHVCVASDIRRLGNCDAGAVHWSGGPL